MSENNHSQEALSGVKPSSTTADRLEKNVGPIPITDTSNSAGISKSPDSDLNAEPRKRQWGEI